MITSFCSVDSLLQVHALHNLLEIGEIENNSAEESSEYTKELERLEWKYLDNSITLVSIFHLICEKEKKSQSVNNIETKRFHRIFPG